MYLALVLCSQSDRWAPLVGDSIVDACNVAMHEVPCHVKIPHETSNLDSLSKVPKTDVVGPLSREAQASTWKGALVGNTKSRSSNLLPKVTAGEDGLEICLPNNIMDNIASSLHLFLVGRFLAFKPTIDMVRRWVGSRWKLKGSVFVSAMPGGLFLFRFTVEEDFIYIMLGSWSYDKQC